MHGLLKQPGYRLYAPGSPEAGALLAERGLGPADLDRALAHLEHAEGTAVRTIVGINEDGVFGVSRAGWRPDLAVAHREPFVPLALAQGPRAARRRARGQHRPVHPGRHAARRGPAQRQHLPAGELRKVTAMNTDQLEHAMNELCHEWMSGKAPTEGVFGTVQAAARVFIFQALSAWSVLEATGQTEQLAPDFQTWLRKILEDEVPYVQRISSVKVSFPKH
jgi:hypothetical protein